MKGKTCCVTGHRDIPQKEIDAIKTKLRQEVEKAISDGFTCFMSGFAEGVDQYFAEIVLEMKKANPALDLVAVIPYRNPHAAESTTKNETCGNSGNVLQWSYGKSRRLSGQKARYRN